MYSMAKANDPAISVPNPLLSPLHKVAPAFLNDDKELKITNELTNMNSYL